MTSRTQTTCGVVAFITLVAVLWNLRLPAYAQSGQPTWPKTRTSSGILVEEVKVGESCVVVVSLEGGGGAISAIPCSR
jgi:hypothetical protein